MFPREKSRELVEHGLAIDTRGLRGLDEVQVSSLAESSSFVHGVWRS